MAALPLVTAQSLCAQQLAVRSFFCRCLSPELTSAAGTQVHGCGTPVVRAGVGWRRRVGLVPRRLGSPNQVQECAWQDRLPRVTLSQPPHHTTPHHTTPHHTTPHHTTSRNFSNCPFAQRSQLGTMVSHARTPAQRREQRRRAEARFAGRALQDGGTSASRFRTITRADARSGRLQGQSRASPR